VAGLFIKIDKMMTPKEKAEELFNKMDMIIYTDQDNWKSQCIRCAVIAVEEVINAITFNMYDEEAYDKENNFWEEVKSELERL
jgi:protein-tyrosine-phosphatase